MRRHGVAIGDAVHVFYFGSQLEEIILTDETLRVCVPELIRVEAEPLVVVEVGGVAAPWSPWSSTVPVTSMRCPT
jgi:hypothetical protein